MPTDLLAIYLRDHHAGATAGLEVARRAAGANRGSELGAFLERLAREIEEDRGELERIMGARGLRPSRAKDTGAWLAAKAGKLKLNGQLRGYSPLSRVLELEGLVMGVTGKLALWRALEAVTGDAALPGLQERAEAQRAELERHHAEAVRAAFG